MMVLDRNQAVAQSVLTYSTLAVFAIVCSFPLLWMIDTALKPIEEVRTAIPTFLIERPTLDNFRKVLTEGDFLIYFRNSMIVALSSTLLTLCLSVFCGYALSRWPRQPASRAITGALLISQMIPGVLLLVPLYILIRTMGLLSTYWALIIVYASFTIPLCTLMLKSFFDTIPKELEEASEIDGCGQFGFIYRILLPLSAPGILAVGVFAFIAAWNEFMFGYVLINNDARRTITAGIMIFKGQHTTDWGNLMAASVLAVVPVVLCFVYLQRFLVAGLAAGAVKG